MIRPIEISVTLDPVRVGRDAGRIADDVIAHLGGLLGSKVKVTLDIEVEIPAGTLDSVVRIVTENSRTLMLTSQGIENEKLKIEISRRFVPYVPHDCVGFSPYL